MSTEIYPTLIFFLSLENKATCRLSHINDDGFESRPQFKINVKNGCYKIIFTSV